MNKTQLIQSFDPNGVGAQGTLFGLPFDIETADLVIIPVPWEVTVSYSAGTAAGPEAVLNASPQLDLYQYDIDHAWKMGIAMLPIPEHIAEMSDKYRALAANYINWLEEGEPEEERERFIAVPSLIDKAAEEMNAWVREQTQMLLAKGKLVALLGGDHSTPRGMLQAMAEKHDSFGVLQIDAHADLRVDYEGFENSHASIMHNVLKLPQVSKMVQVGIRDYCEAEANYVMHSGGRIVSFYDHAIKAQQYEGKSWQAICQDIISALPDKVYVTIDIDGLDPKLCPNTGTPVAGGFELEQMLYLMKQLVKSGKEMIGFDLVEVAPGPDGDEWDGNVGARVLYRMANLLGVSQKRLSFND